MSTPNLPDDYNREHAWTNEQHTKSNEQTYDGETKAPAGYQAALGAMQINTPNIANDYNREHAWT